MQKVLAAAGVASRRECEQIILEGRVEVDGEVVTELGSRVRPGEQTIHFDGEQLRTQKLVYFAVNKPTGVVCTSRDPDGRPRVIDMLPPDIGRVFTVGRLDLASEGLILVTNDGALANRLTHPRHGVRKVYEVQVAGEVGPTVVQQLKKGVHLAEGFAQASGAKVKSKKKRSSVLEMTLEEGRNREVRRLLARLGHKVQRLTRIAVGPIRLGELPLGATRKLAPEEVSKLRKWAEESRPTNRPKRRRRRPEKTGQSATHPGKEPGRRVIGSQPKKRRAK
ncbi:MAG: pseudouridine synthase [Planctomycetota bacterium]